MGRKKKFKIGWDRSADGASDAAIELFFTIADEHGLDVAREIFVTTALLYGELSKREKDWLILRRLDSMKPEPNVVKLARELNAEGWGEVPTVDHRIRELVRKRKKAMANGTWLPVAPRPDDANEEAAETLRRWSGHRVRRPPVGFSQK